jgi:transposase InsO family protein
MIQSMSRKGECHDNAVAESFFNTIKTELINQQTYRTIEQASKGLL